jgi:hypothetical protein
MTAELIQEGRGMLAIQLTGANDANNGGLGAVLNPEGVDLLILRTYLYVKAHSTGAANLGIGVAANGTTKATDILNDLAMGGAIDGKYYNGGAVVVAAKTEMTGTAVWSAGKYLTFTGSADTSGLDATLYVEYLRAN